MYSIYTLIKQAVNSYYGRITKFKIISRNIFNNDLLVSVETYDNFLLIKIPVLTDGRIVVLRPHRIDEVDHIHIGKEDDQ
jgi:hypothetical protein